MLLGSNLCNDPPAPHSPQEMRALLLVDFIQGSTLTNAGHRDCWYITCMISACQALHSISPCAPLSPDLPPHTLYAHPHLHDLRMACLALLKAEALLRKPAAHQGARELWQQRLHAALPARASARSTVVSSGQQWSAVVSSGQQWSAVVNSGQQWSTVVNSGQQWSAVRLQVSVSCGCCPLHQTGEQPQSRAAAPRQSCTQTELRRH